jgi:uncharacterized phage protein (TIGR01671 family)
MRTIKFRAWDEEKKEWVTSRLTFGLNPAKFQNESETKAVAVVFAGEGRCVIEQFTGLLDKNGKEIYEGDIVHYSYDYTGKDNWEVCWGSDSWIMKRGEKETGYDNYYDDPHTNRWDETEIIGNVHQNPELLNP